MDNKLKETLWQSNRYHNFILLEAPTAFNQMFKDKDYDTVQVHCIYQTLDKDIVGFAGAFSWIDNNIKSLDGDSYYEDTPVYGYETFDFTETEEEQLCHGIDILVMDF